MDNLFKKKTNEKENIENITQNINSSDSINAIDKIKVILKEHEIEENNNKELGYKKESVTNFLKTTLNLISDDPEKKLADISESIEEWIECNKIEMEMIQNSIDDYNKCLSSNTDKIKKQIFSEKVHLYRESFLSMLFYNDKNLKSLYYLILTLSLWLFLWVMIDDLKTTGSIINTKFWKDTFFRIDLICIFWFVLFLYSLLIVPFVKIVEFSSKQNNKINYYITFTIYFIYQFCLYLMAFFMVLNNEFALPCKIILACESTRISLKIHGYFREKILYGLKEYHMEYATFSPNSKNITNEEEIKLSHTIMPDIKIYDFLTEMKKYLYYFYCPSLIYRDAYPTINRYRWNLIVAHFTNFKLCILFNYILMRYICDPYFNFSKLKDYYSLPHFIFDSLRFAIPGVTLLVVGFFLLLHSWLNLWSELLRHGDRRFYEDWWNCTNFEEYYRKWNMVVHEWLYYYVYNDVIRLSLGKWNRFHGKIAVFVLSIILHEIILWIALGFFFPVLSFFFGGPGIIFTYIKTKNKQFNVLLWLELFLGKGLILVFYLREINMRNIINELGLIEPWHEWIPRTILMYTDSYKFLIQKSKFY